MSQEGVLLCAGGLLRSQERARLGSGAGRAWAPDKPGKSGQRRRGVVGGWVAGGHVKRADMPLESVAWRWSAKGFRSTEHKNSAVQLQRSCCCVAARPKRLQSSPTTTPFPLKPSVSTPTSDATCNVSFTRTCRVPTRT